MHGSATHLARYRETLERKREFRRHQLVELERWERLPDHAFALREVHSVVADGARTALTNIELALSRMRAGTYGRCRACGSEIPPSVLEAIPESTLCLSCYRRSV